MWPLAPLTFHCLQLGLVLSARGIHIPLDAVCMTEQAAVLGFCCLFVAGIEKYSDFLILICFHINWGSFKMCSFFLCTQSHYEFYFFFPNPQACFSRLGNYWTHMVAALLTHKCCLWLDSYLLSLLDWGGSLRFLVPVKRFHNEWSLHFINTFPASTEMGFSLSPD